MEVLVKPDGQDIDGGFLCLRHLNTEAWLLQLAADIERSTSSSTVVIKVDQYE